MTGATTVAQALNSAGYTVAQIQQALTDAFNMTFTSAAALLADLGIS